ncbi:hypothetical protein HNP84_002103 [Thermocatellispora tengchongensis]|uniref:Uncharacterized protein n=1 Tax=Thermocatellispora tengchongensis TaxID=1073253 RepID=A0A840P589_9ACTN|nr:hypothetical protein [Thermocatellispora tengchongensis]MBB5132387.1 hypothetical protein [Thermocatellispora tengchongensis]
MREDDRWKVLIEELEGSEREWRLTQVTAAGPERAGAVGLAEQMARTYVPRHPWSPRRRHLYRVGEGTWLVEVEGATRDFHFRVTLAEYVETI